MGEKTLEQRVAELETRVATLQTIVANGQRPKDWRRTIGMFTGDDGMKELFAEAMKLREKDREKARRRSAKQRKAKA